MSKKKHWHLRASEICTRKDQEIPVLLPPIEALAHAGARISREGKVWGFSIAHEGMEKVLATLRMNKADTKLIRSIEKVIEETREEFLSSL